MNQSLLVGRQAEQEQLNHYMRSPKAEFIAVYGRRRVGKTYLISENCQHKGFYFELTGIKDASLSTQLSIFAEKYSKTFLNNISIEQPNSWLNAFSILTLELEKIKKNQKIILFFDELPWFASRKSGFLEALDYYWNHTWSRMPNLKLIVCGSAASWMLDNLINAKGGLYNRITHTILVRPFTLNETASYFKAFGYNYSHKQILEIYMILGGIPFYLQQFIKNKSIAENINRICFMEDGILYHEFDRLFKSLFTYADINKNIIQNIAKKPCGISRNELLVATKIKSGGTFNKRIEELRASGFIQIYIPFGKKKKDQYFKLIDEYSAFYLKWIESLKQKQTHLLSDNYWQNTRKTQSWKSWSGFAFERVCFKHARQIQKALNLYNTPCELSSWQYIPKRGSNKVGAQIDMLFNRDDDAITLCEIKYCDNILIFDKKIAREVAQKMAVFEDKAQTQKQLFIAVITTVGMKPNMWSEDLIHNVVTLNDLFIR